MFNFGQMIAEGKPEAKRNDKPVIKLYLGEEYRVRNEANVLLRI